jgi:hypothetical protein
LDKIRSLPKRFRNAWRILKENWALPGVSYQAIGWFLFDERWSEAPMSHLICDAQIRWDEAANAGERRSVCIWIHANVLLHSIGWTTLETVKHWLFGSLLHWFR